MRVTVCFVIILCFFLPPVLHAQVNIRGTILDINTNRPIPDVNVYLLGTMLGTTSNSSGRFLLQVERVSDTAIIVFQHIAYETRSMPVDSVMMTEVILLKPRIIPIQPTEITGRAPSATEATRDVPAVISVIDAKEFDIRGYIDAGDMLRIDHSVQIDEHFSGKKLLSMRGGNADETIVLYDGIRLNSAYDNLFDVSLIDLTDVERVELIKGSNTSLYGSEAFSGVVNVVPKSEKGYVLRFQQQIGSYDSGIWGLYAHHGFTKAKLSYSVRSGGQIRNFLDTPEERMKNSAVHHTASLVYDLDHGTQKRSVTGLLRFSTMDFDNTRDRESLTDKNNLFSLKYSGDAGPLQDFMIVGAFTNLNDRIGLLAGNNRLDRRIEESALHLNARNRFLLHDMELTAAYQFQHASLEYSDRRFDVFEQPSGLERVTYNRDHHGGVMLWKIHSETGSSFLRTFDVNAGMRYDYVHDVPDDIVTQSQSVPVVVPVPKSWDGMTYKFAVSLSGGEQSLVMNTFLNYGTNLKFPSLFQQVSSPVSLVLPVSGTANLAPEKNTSAELGLTASGVLTNNGISGWQVNGSFFQNIYDNKFRMLATPGSPVVFYDNVSDAQISGFELKATVYLFQKLASVDVGFSRYFISNQSAFPFKSDFKRTIGFNVDHRGLSLQILWFAEGEQVGILRTSEGHFAEARLPEFNNMDVHAGGTFFLWSVTGFLNLSLRNILNDDTTELSGLALRDRRYYVTVGVQY